MSLVKKITVAILLTLLLPVGMIAYADDTDTTATEAATEDSATPSDEDSTESVQGIPMCPKEVNKEEYSYTSFIESQIEKYNLENITAATARVVEISEALPGSAATETSVIVDVYKGYCCSEADDKNDRCLSMVNLYFESSEGNQEEGKTGCNDVAAYCSPVQLIISTTGINLLKFYALQIYIWGASIVGIVAVLIIIISGIQIAASGGEEAVSSAKTRITQALAGIALLFLSGLILYTINPTFFIR